MIGKNSHSRIPKNRIKSAFQTTHVNGHVMKVLRLPNQKQLFHDFDFFPRYIIQLTLRKRSQEKT